MGLFPAYIEDEELLEESPDEVEIPREFGIDFTTGQLTGGIVEGIEAVKVWCYIALQVARYRYFICSWEYGSEIEDLFGKGYSADHLKSEISRMTEECLLTNENIESVRITNETYRNGRFSANINVTTIFGEESEEIYETEVE